MTVLTNLNILHDPYGPITRNTGSKAAFRVAANVDDIVERLRHQLARSGIEDIQRASDERNRTQSAEIETTDIEVAADEESFVKRDTRIREALDVGHNGTHRQ